MRMRGARIACLLAAAALALPGAAWAQSAGDEQYQDPFPDQQEQPDATPEPTPEATAPAPAPATSEPAQTAQAAPTAAPASATVTQNQLPRTGADAGLIALGGALLLGGGLVLRRRTR